MTIFETWKLRVTLCSIRNSCYVYEDEDEDYGDDLNHIIPNHEGMDVKSWHFLGHVLRDLVREEVRWKPI